MLPLPTLRGVLTACLLGSAVLAPGAALVGCAACPSFLNSNCGMDVRVALDGPAGEINGGGAFQVSVVALHAEDPVAGRTNREWIREGRRLEAPNRRLDFVVRSGRIEVPNRVSDPKTRFEIEEGGELIEIDLTGLGNPDEGGYARLAVFTDMAASMDAQPLVVPYGEIKESGWNVRLGIGPGGVQIVRDAAL